jgi:hypothetical protein
MLASKKIYLCEAQNPILSNLLHTVYKYKAYLFTHERWGRGRVEPERRLEEQQFTKLLENTNMTDCISSL